MASTATVLTSLSSPLSGAITIQPVNANVHSVHLADGAHVGNLKRVGTGWKFKAVGYDLNGAVEPGGGALTHQNNVVFAQPDAAEVSARLLDSHAAMQPT